MICAFSPQGSGSCKRRRVDGPARRHVEAASLRPSRSVMTGRETVHTWLCWEDSGFAGEAALPRTRALPGSAGW